jgi:hypothetical protein
MGKRQHSRRRGGGLLAIFMLGVILIRVGADTSNHLIPSDVYRHYQCHRRHQGPVQSHKVPSGHLPSLPSASRASLISPSAPPTSPPSIPTSTRANDSTFSNSLPYAASSGDPRDLSSSMALTYTRHFFSLSKALTLLCSLPMTSTVPLGITLVPPPPRGIS